MGAHGYNTPSSRKSKEHWDYAQSIAPDIFIKYGAISFIFILIFIILFLLLSLSMEVLVYLGMVIGFIFLIISIIIVERKIRIKFSN
jgi:hypothetical protein